jgi:uncharacterized protein YbjQ (UPF0145 family)
MAAHELYRKAYDAHYNDGDYDKAIEGYKRLIELYPESAEAGFAKKKLPIAQLEKNKRKGGQKKEKTANEDEKSSPVKVKLTTANTLEGYKISKTLGVISGKSASEMNISSGSSEKDGGDKEGICKTAEELFRKTRIACLKKLQKNAVTIGANAVIAIRLSHNEIYGDKSILSISAYGTAVFVDKN